jgi:hypothetical protein
MRRSECRNELARKIKTGELIRAGGRLFRAQEFFEKPFEEQWRLLHGEPRPKPKRPEPTAPKNDAKLQDWLDYAHGLRQELSELLQLTLPGFSSEDAETLRCRIQREEELKRLVARAQQEIQKQRGNHDAINRRS